MTSFCVITVRLRPFMTSLIVAVTHHDTSTSTRHYFALDFGRKKTRKCYELEVFCEVVRFPRVHSGFPWGGYEGISENKYFLRWCPNFFNDHPLGWHAKSRVIFTTTHLYSIDLFSRVSELFSPVRENNFC
jgi:hypothetical protein